MAVERKLIPYPNEEVIEEPIDLFIEDEVQEEDPEEAPVEMAFDANLAEILDDNELHSIAVELLACFDADERSREEWLNTYVDGLDLLGMKKEDRSEPWDGACGVVHPILTEAVVRFQSNAIMEMFPATGPAKAFLVGDETKEKTEQAGRVIDEINYQLTENMVEYRGETEQLLFRLPLAGSIFRKVYHDPIKHRPCAMMVTAEDFVVDYGATDLDNCERYTHVMRRSKNEVAKLQEAGFYRDIDLPDPMTDMAEGREKEQDLTGHRPSYEKETRHTLLEMHVEMDLGLGTEEDKGVRCYIITIEKASCKVLSIYRNWNPDDPIYAKKQYFVHFQYMPGLGFYGFGLIHLLGGIASSATSIIRQLIDAGTLSNLPGGLKTRGLRTKEEDLPIAPGEWRDVDVPSGQIRENLFPLPYKEPSAVLFSLYQNLVDEGRRIGSVADIEVGEMHENSPVGTILALLERSMKVMSAVHARLHAALRRELGLIAQCIGEYMPPQYEWDAEGKFNRQQDFDGRIDVIPVSDPNAATQTARVVQLQAVTQMAQMNPEIYDLKELHRAGLEAIQFKNIDRIIPLDKPPPPTDPVTENMHILVGKPVKAYMEQEHDAHLKVHLSAMSDPKIMGLVQKSPNAPKLQAAMESHIAEHLGFSYRRTVEKLLGQPLPPPDQPMPPEVEAQVSLAVANITDQVLEQHRKDAEEFAKIAAAADPLYALREREIAAKEQKMVHDSIMAENKLMLDLSKTASDANMAEEKLYSQERQTAAKIAADLITFEEELDAREKADARQMGVEISRDIRRDVIDVSKTRADNTMRREEGKRVRKGIRRQTESRKRNR